MISNNFGSESLKYFKCSKEVELAGGGSLTNGASHLVSKRMCYQIMFMQTFYLTKHHITKSKEMHV